MQKAVVFGSAGQLGLELVKELRLRGYAVTALNRASVDISDLRAVETCLTQIDPAVVLNAAAYNQVDIAETEPQTAYSANALAVRNLAVACRQMDCLLVHFSTDYVFDGVTNRPYVETDPTHPLGAYAVSKLAGELYAQAYVDPLIIRVSGVFGPGGQNTVRGNFVELMVRLAKSGQPIRVVEDHVASPTFAPAIASRTVDMVERRMRGVFHLAGGQPISWYNWAKLIFASAGLNPELKPTNEREYRTAARRPKFSALSNSKVEKAGIAAMPSLTSALEQYWKLR